MSTRITSFERHIEMPLMALYTSCVIARQQDRFADFQELREALVQVGARGRGQRLAQKALTGQPNSLIPFVRDEVDVYTACAAINSCDQEPFDFRFFSDASAIQAGYFTDEEGVIQYVDRTGISSLKANKAPELLPRDLLHQILRTVGELDRKPAAVVVPDNPNLLLEIESEALEVCAGSAGGFKAEVVLLRADPSTIAGGIQRRLTQATIRRRSAGLCSLELRPEHMMEIHAAGIAGQWLLIEADDLRLLTPLPDFEAIGARVDAWFQPTSLFCAAINDYSDMPISVNLHWSLAVSLMRRHHWCGAVDAIQWFSAIQRPEPNSQGTSHS